MKSILIFLVIGLMPVVSFSEALDQVGVGSYGYCYRRHQLPPMPTEPNYRFNFPGFDTMEGQIVSGPFDLILWRQNCKVFSADGSKILWSGNALYYRIVPLSLTPVSMSQYFLIEQGAVKGVGHISTESRMYKMSDMKHGKPLKGNPQITPFGGLLGVFVTGFDPDKDFELSLVDGPDSTHILKTVKVPASEGWMDRVKRWFK